MDIIDLINEEKKVNSKEGAKELLRKCYLFLKENHPKDEIEKIWGRWGMVDGLCHQYDFAELKKELVKENKI